MTTLNSLEVDLTVVLGKTRLPLQRLLRLGRGAVLAFGKAEGELVEILANDHPIARGQITVRGSTIAIEVKELVRKPEIERQHGASIGGQIKADALLAA